MATLRAVLLPVHRWAGLTIGLIIVMSALTGAAMVFRPQLDPVVYPGLFKTPACATRVPLATLVANAHAVHPKGKMDFVRIIQRPGAPASIRFVNKDTIYLNPCTGAVLGQQNRYEGFFGRMEQLHRFVYVKNGGWVVGAGALVFALVMILGGAVLWWSVSSRFLASALKFRFGLKGQAFTVSLHKTVGIYAAPIVLISALTGLPQAFEPVREAIYSIGGKSAEAHPHSTVVPGKKPLGPDVFWAQLQARVPNAREALIHFALKPGQPIEAFAIGPDAPNPNARSYLYMDAYSGSPLSFTPYRASGVGTKIYYWMLSLHNGQVGGVFGQVLMFLGVLAVPCLGYTGASSYVRRLTRRSGQRAPAAAVETPLLRVRVRSIRDEAVGIRSFELAPVDDAALPDPEPGAHVDVHLEDGVVRQYSLCNGPEDRSSYIIAVRREPHSRGGSEAMHTRVEPGSLLSISAPRNHFPIRADAKHHLLMARGIGITPLLAMARFLEAKGASYSLQYFASSIDKTAFHEPLSQPPFADKVSFHYAVEPERLGSYLHTLLWQRPEGAHLYVCGGRSFMDAVEAAATPAWPPDVVHREYFTADPLAWSGPRSAFDVVLAHSGRTVRVGPEDSIIGALQKNGVAVPTSCEQGVCGTCLTGVLKGAPDHRDAFLTEAERRRGDKMMLCVSRAKTSQLVLDL